jgi:hypothetical protein
MSSWIIRIVFNQFGFINDFYGFLYVYSVIKSFITCMKSEFEFPGSNFALYFLYLTIPL